MGPPRWLSRTLVLPEKCDQSSVLRTVQKVQKEAQLHADVCDSTYVPQCVRQFTYSDDNCDFCSIMGQIAKYLRVCCSCEKMSLFS